MYALVYPGVGITFELNLFVETAANPRPQKYQGCICYPTDSCSSNTNRDLFT